MAYGEHAKRAVLAVRSNCLYYTGCDQLRFIFVMRYLELPEMGTIFAFSLCPARQQQQRVPAATNSLGVLRGGVTRGCFSSGSSAAKELSTAMRVREEI